METVVNIALERPTINDHEVAGVSETYHFDRVSYLHGMTSISCSHDRLEESSTFRRVARNALRCSNTLKALGKNYVCGLLTCRAFATPT